ncbi:hypothetical protein K5B43_003823 [Vibrio parahaemolyticus]|uniref:hypothetical protein n=1 Tax=Vibrio parahaemolyticus TaxID=670 RepID=UPI00084AB31D|nr:hypothetical protein [Vibrio parahaemolyticus]EGQ9275220.1 hypothetical protein [Vibrio parahaemolyticus]EGQ9712413.1 hypothetical protein [Vibrio parahaemolyticus]EHY9860525.1 hypothetical protein [Vibrio parahaemolyticus]EIA0904611.1 hypothetical protein [Vibrio parahaemolyticus]EID0733695.1 hypothetical protein [Vibrio parahaemolyticus]
MGLALKIRDNSWLFLRRAIRELINHDDSKDDGLTKETAIFGTTFIQISFELALVAYYLEKEGIQGIVKGPDLALTTEELVSKFERNELNTKSFNVLKNKAISENIFLNETDADLISEFQRVRNKLVHLNYEFCDGDLYDLKYDLTYFIVKIIMPILSDNYQNPSEVISTYLNKSDFFKLISFPPYAGEMYRVAKEYSDNVYDCVHCGNKSLAVDIKNEQCYSCGALYLGLGFIDCPYCNSNNSMIYDALNIKGQPDLTIKGLCLECKEDDIVYLCKKCWRSVALEGYVGLEKCHPEYCEWDD